MSTTPRRVVAVWPQRREAGHPKREGVAPRAQASRNGASIESAALRRSRAFTSKGTWVAARGCRHPDSHEVCHEAWQHRARAVSRQHPAQVVHGSMLDSPSVGLADTQRPGDVPVREASNEPHREHPLISLREMPQGPPDALALHMRLHVSLEVFL